MNSEKVHTIVDQAKKITLGVLVAACLVSFIYKAASLQNKSKQVVLSFYGTNLPYENALKAAASSYNELQHDYEVVIDKQDAGNYRTWMGARLAGGNSSDILATNISYANTDAQNGYLCDLSEYLNQANPYSTTGVSWAKDFSGTYLQQTAYANDTSKFYCLPTSTVSVRLMINKDLFAKYGIALPSEEWTFSDFRKICEAFENNGVTALEIANAKFINYMVSWMIDIMLAQVEYDSISLWDTNKNRQIETQEICGAFLGNDKIDLTKDTGFNEVMEFLKKYSAYFGTGFNSRNDASENFFRQRTPMYFCGSWGVSGLELTLANENPDADKTNPYDKFSYYSLPFPKLTSDVYLNSSENFHFSSLKKVYPYQELGEPSDCFCIPKTDIDKGTFQGAVGFLQYLTSPTGASQTAKIAYMIPITKGVEINDAMKDYLPPEDSESIRMRFNLLNLGDGVAEEYHFKQVQLYLMQDSSAISLATFTKNIENKYLEVTSALAEENGWEF